jgi:hypothetical protein
MSPMFVPGPVDVSPDVLQQQTKAMMPHRSKDFEAIFRRSAEKLQQIFYTQYRIFIMTNSAVVRRIGSAQPCKGARVELVLMARLLAGMMFQLAMESWRIRSKSPWAR